MSRIGMWFWLSCKRYLFRYSFLAILLLFPLGTFLIRSSQEDKPVEIRIAVYAQEAQDGENTDGLEYQLVQKLVSREPEEGLFRFYACESEQQVEDEVASRRAECGYIITAGLREKLDRRDFKRSIRVFSSPATIGARLSSETVFAEMIELYDRDLFLQYVQEKNESVPEAEIRERAGELYDKWKENGSTFHFVYEYVDQEQTISPEDSGTSVFPVRGIVAVYIFITGLYGAVISLEDERKGLFQAVPYKSRTLCRLASMAAPVCLSALSGLAALWTGKCVGEAGRELAALILYGIAVVVFSWAVRQLCRREELVCCLIPFFLVGSLILCPVFLDIGKYLPEFAAVGKFFLPGYYIRIFS